MKVLIPYLPHARQKEIHEDNHRYRVVVCGRRLGKTILAVNETIKWATIKPDNYWYICPTYKQVKLVAWEYLKYYCVPEIRLGNPNESELSQKLVNGSTIRLIGADNPESLRGVGLGGAVFDEFADIKRNVWPQIIRPMLTISKGPVLFIGTPKGKANHLYELFISDPQKNDKDYKNIFGDGIDPDSDFKSWQLKSIENPYLDPKEIESAKKNMTKEYFLQEYEASFENYTGIIYKEYTEAHNIQPIELKPWFSYYCGIDTGRVSAHTFIAVDGNDKAYVFDEIYDYDKTVKEYAERIKKKVIAWKIPKITYIIDSASQVKREYRENGIVCLDSEKDVLNSIEIVRSRFKTNRLSFFKGCTANISEHSGYVWDENKTDRGQPVPKKDADHAVNTVQYVLGHTMNLKGKHEPQKIAPDKTLAAIAARRERRGREHLG